MRLQTKLLDLLDEFKYSASLPHSNKLEICGQIERRLLTWIDDRLYYDKMDE